jgi:hypothetical protein
VLERLDRVRVERTVHRCGSLKHVSALAEAEKLTPELIVEVVTFMREGVLNDLMRGPFLEKPLVNPPRAFGCPTRFSNGDWPIFYSALEPVVAEAEAKYHYGKDAQEDETDRRPMYYSLVRCKFAGTVVDLVAKQGEAGWEGLTADDHTFCQGLGAEAKQIEMDGFLTPSARAVGVNVPVFTAESLAKPVIGRTIRLSYDVATGSVRSEFLAE